MLSFGNICVKWTLDDENIYIASHIGFFIDHTRMTEFEVLFVYVGLIVGVISHHIWFISFFFLFFLGIVFSKTKVAYIFVKFILGH